MAHLAARQRAEEEAAAARGGPMRRPGNRPRDGPLGEIDRIYRMLDQGMYNNHGVREDKFTLDDAFTYVESHVDQTRNEPLY